MQSGLTDEIEISQERGSGLVQSFPKTAVDFRDTYIQQLLKAINVYDQEIMRRPGFAAAFCEASAECFAHGSEGLVKDAELLYQAWDFDVRLIHRRVHLWQGLDDQLVPAAINQEIADQMPGAVWHPIPGAGHFVAIGMADEVLGLAATELSQKA